MLGNCQGYVSVTLYVCNFEKKIVMGTKEEKHDTLSSP
jgi:hypothetical protein